MLGSPRRVGTLAAGACALAIAVIGPTLDGYDRHSSANPAALRAPLLTDCHPETTQAPTWSRITGADQHLLITNLCDGIRLSLEVARFITQEKGKEAVAHGNRIVEPRLVSAARPQVRRLPGGLEVRVFQIDRGLEPGTLWSWYAVADESAATPTRAKLMELLNAAVLHGSDTSILTLVAWSEDADANELLLERAALEVWAWYLQRGGA